MHTNNGQRHQFDQSVDGEWGPTNKSHCHEYSRAHESASPRSITVWWPNALSAGHEAMTSSCRWATRARLLCATVLSLCILAASEAATTPKCTREDAQRAEIEASSLKTWQQVFDSYGRYRRCDDGAISEGYSSSIATLLATGWDDIGELLPLIKSHPDFERFVLRHLDDTMSRDQDARIQSNVRDACPTNAAQFCAAVRKRFAILNSV
jgi:hypothetical protein